MGSIPVAGAIEIRSALVAGLVFMIFHRNERAKGAVRIPPGAVYCVARRQKHFVECQERMAKIYPAQQIPVAGATS